MITLEITSLRKVSSSLYSVPFAWLKWTDSKPIKEANEEAGIDVADQIIDLEETIIYHKPTKIRFNAHDEYESSDIVHVLTPQVRSEMWYTKKEIYAMRTETKDVVREKRLTRDSHNFSVRGLEDTAFMRVAMEKKARKAAVVRGVLNEQQRQKGPQLDWEKVRRKSKLASRDAVKMALHYAMQDADEVRNDREDVVVYSGMMKTVETGWSRSGSTTTTPRAESGWSRNNSSTTTTPMVAKVMVAPSSSRSLVVKHSPPSGLSMGPPSLGNENVRVRSPTNSTCSKLEYFQTAPSEGWSRNAPTNRKDDPSDDKIPPTPKSWAETSWGKLLGSTLTTTSTTKRTDDRSGAPRSPRVVVPIKPPNRRITADTALPTCVL